MYRMLRKPLARYIYIYIYILFRRLLALKRGVIQPYVIHKI
jgi:hypothetical protein